MSALKSKLFLGFVAVLILLGGAFAYLQFSGGHAHKHGHAGAEHVHDEVNMPGLKGENASDEESAELALMFRRFETLERTVENLPNGIRTVTSSSDPEVMEALTSHIIGMIDRVETGDDPKILIQSPTLDLLFERREAIVTEIDIIDAGVVVIKTSDDPAVVQVLQVHAAEVSDMAARGMQAVHDMMSKRHH